MRIKNLSYPSKKQMPAVGGGGTVARQSKISLTLSQVINSVSSKDVKSNNLGTWNAVLVQRPHNLGPRVIQVVGAPIRTQMASRSVYSMTGINAEAMPLSTVLQHF